MQAKLLGWLPSGLLLAATLVSAQSVAPDLKFQRFDQRDGLPTAPVGTIMEDEKGLIWLATWDGLYRYDGRNFKGYFHDPDDPSTISGKWVTGLLLDSKNRMWLGTLGAGLNLFNRATGTFTSFRHNPDDPHSISGDAVGWVIEERNGRIWVLTGSGLNLFDPDTHHSERYTWDEDNPNSLAGNFVRDVYETSEGIVWVGTGNPFVGGEPGGLNRLNLETGDVDRFLPNPDDPLSVENYIEVVHPTPDGSLWVTSWRKGLYEFDPVAGRFGPLVVRLTDFVSSDFGFGIVGLVEGLEPGVLWLSVFRGGLLRYDSNSGETTRYDADPTDPFSLPDSRVWQPYIGSDGTLWVATHTGLVKTDLAGRHESISLPSNMQDEYVVDLATLPDRRVAGGTSGHRAFLWDGEDVRELATPTAGCSGYRTEGTAVTPSSAGGLWVLTRCGLFEFDSTFQKRSRIRVPLSASQITAPDPLRIREDEDGWIWVGPDEAIYRLHPKTAEIETYPYLEDGTGLNHRGVDILYLGTHNAVWIGTEEGMNRIVPGSGEIESFSFEDIYQTPAITGISQATDTTYWLSTDQVGLVRMDRDGSILETVGVRQGLDLSSQLGVLVADNGTIWGRSVRGLSVVDPVSGGVRTFDASDGIVDATFAYHSITSGPYGQVLVGGKGGFNVINPNNLFPSDEPPTTILDELIVNGRPVEAGPDAPLQTELSYASRINLPYKQNDVQVSFLSPEFRFPDQVSYQFRLDPKDDTWIDNGSSQSVRYNSLAPGTWTLRVRARAGLGPWSSSPADLEIVIAPPWWRSTAAWIAYLLLVIGAVWAGAVQLSRRAVRREKERAREKELEQARELADAYAELERTHVELKNTQARMSALKSRFFANISHEFRTPLTLILGQIDRIRSDRLKADDRAEIDEDVERLNAVTRNGERLLRLINQLLDLSKLEAGAMRLSVQSVEIVPFLRRLLFSFETLADSRNLVLFFDSQVDDGTVLKADLDKLEKIFSNLLSNAIKFTPAGGRVSIRIETGRLPEQVSATCGHDTLEEVCIVVSDTGSGIPADRLDNIFDRFYQVSSPTRQPHEGTGIGLALTKELLDVHDGRIDVESVVGVGTTFRVFLPVNPKLEDDDVEVADSETEAGTELSTPLIAQTYEESQNKAEALGISDDAENIVLVVEDNADLRRFTVQELSPDFVTREAADGRAGFDLAVRLVPDLIISDVMMPEMDGFEMLSLLRKDERTSHIPIIMLTARVEIEDRLEGIERGADAYLEKPFNSHELRLRTQKLIESRNHLRERFRTATQILPSEIEASDIDQAFVARVVDSIEAHMSDSSFSVEMLSREIGMSVSQINRKLNALLGQSSGKLIRSMRLHRAADLLAKNAGTVSEIGFEVGFSSQASLATAFKRQYGKSPSEYRKQVLKGATDA
ncbi:MAG: response regulator [Rhodothermia bacterium]|nr:response regulator [Rhodothermia bacterium]